MSLSILTALHGTRAVPSRFEINRTKYMQFRVRRPADVSKGARIVRDVWQPCSVRWRSTSMLSIERYETSALPSRAGSIARGRQARSYRQIDVLSLSSNSEFASLAGRMENSYEIEYRLGSWKGTRETLLCSLC